jgi:hypothetical protein
VRRDAIKFCLAWFLLSRVLFLAPAYAVFYAFSEPPAPPGYVQTQGPLDRRPLNVLFYYDAVHYLRIAREGYSREEAPWYPLYPLAVRLFGGTAASAVAVSNLAFFLGLLGLYRLGGRRAVVLACVSPTGIVFSSAYSESLFFCLTSWALALKETSPCASGLFAGLAAACRAPGLGLTPALLADFARDRSGRRLAAVVFAAVGAAVHPLYLWAAFGDPALGAAVNAARFRRWLEPPWWGVAGDLARLVGGGFIGLQAALTCLNLWGLAWLLPALAGPCVPAAVAYGLFVLSFPVHAAWPCATHGLLRYACAWPGGYVGLARLLRSKAGFGAAAAASAVSGCLVSVLVALKAFVF